MLDLQNAAYNTESPQIPLHSSLSFWRSYICMVHLSKLWNKFITLLLPKLNSEVWIIFGFYWCLFKTHFPGCHIVLSHNLFSCFSDCFIFSCFNNLDSFLRYFVEFPPNWNLSDVFLMSRMGLHVFGKKSTEVKCSHTSCQGLVSSPCPVIFTLITWPQAVLGFFTINVLFPLTLLSTMF
jgi:hypothetical protein